MQVLQLWDFFLSQPPTIIITLAASIIILRVDAIKGCLNDQVSLLSAPPAVDLLRCKVPPLSLATASPMCVTLCAKEYAASLTTSIPQCTFCMAGKDFRLWCESRFRFSLCAGFNPRDTHTCTTRFSVVEGVCITCIDSDTVRAMLSEGEGFRRAAKHDCGSNCVQRWPPCCSCAGSSSRRLT